MEVEEAAAAAPPHPIPAAAAAPEAVPEATPAPQAAALALGSEAGAALQGSFGSGPGSSSSSSLYSSGSEENSSEDEGDGGGGGRDAVLPTPPSTADELDLARLEERAALLGLRQQDAGAGRGLWVGEWGGDSLACRLAGQPCTSLQGACRRLLTSAYLLPGAAPSADGGKAVEQSQRVTQFQSLEGVAADTQVRPARRRQVLGWPPCACSCASVVAAPAQLPASTPHCGPATNPIHSTLP